MADECPTTASSPFETKPGHTLTRRSGCRLDSSFPSLTHVVQSGLTRAIHPFTASTWPRHPLPWHRPGRPTHRRAGASAPQEAKRGPHAPLVVEVLDPHNNLALLELHAGTASPGRSPAESRLVGVARAAAPPVVVGPWGGWAPPRPDPARPSAVAADSSVIRRPNELPQTSASLTSADLQSKALGQRGHPRRRSARRAQLTLEAPAALARAGVTACRR